MKKQKEKKYAYGIREINEKVIHKYPFLLIDRILEVNDEYALGLKNVTVNEPFFPGHFPGAPVMPAVLVLESMVQLAGIYIKLLYDIDPKNLGYFVGIEKARFKRVVEPGDQLMLKAVINNKKGGFYKCSCQSTVEDEIAATANFTVYIEAEKTY